MRVFKNIIFIIILCIGILGMSEVTQLVLQNNENYVQTRNKSYYAIQKEKKNSIDVITVGDSLSYSSISPMELWENYGITSFVCGQSGQNIQEMYYMLKNVFKTQSPKLVILETNVFFKEQSITTETKQTVEEWAKYNIPLIGEHDVWKSLITGKEYTEESYKGFSFRCNIDSYKKGEYMKETNSKETIPKVTLFYMNKIIKLCNEHNAEIILFSAPSPQNYNYSKHNSISDYANKQNLKYINMNLKVSEIGINWKTDSLDKGDHLNYLGARKVTAYLGKYLNENYNLEDHRGDSDYSSWEMLKQEYDKKALQYIKQMK